MSELIPTQKNKECIHYEKFDTPVIKVVECGRGNRELKITSNSILMVLRGGGNISFRQFANKTITGGDILLLPIHTHVRFFIEERITILVFRLPPSVRFCDHFSLQALFEEKDKRKRQKFITLKMNQRLKSYINSLLPCLADGLKCHYFLELKTRELFFILRAYNTKSDLAAFFSPMVTGDSEFYAFVIENYKSVKTAEELAEKAGYTYSGFDKLFKRTFGVTVKAWLKEQLLANLRHEIIFTKKTFQEIGDAFGFSSLSHLTRFCSRTFGMNPTNLRKKNTLQSKNKKQETTNKQA